jgi:hypothetical protein
VIEMIISLNITRLPCVCSEVDGEIIPSDECISGPKISDSMIQTEAVAIARASAEINLNSSDRMKISGSTPFDTFHRPGLLAIFTDYEQGDFRTIIEKSAISIRIGNPKGSEEIKYTADLNLMLEREYDSP